MSISKSLIFYSEIAIVIWTKDFIGADAKESQILRSQL